MSFHVSTSNFSKHIQTSLSLDFDDRLYQVWKTMKDFVWYFRRRTILFACLNIHLELRLWSVWFDLRWGCQTEFFLRNYIWKRSRKKYFYWTIQKSLLRISHRVKVKSIANLSQRNIQRASAENRKYWYRLFRALWNKYFGLLDVVQIMMMYDKNMKFRTAHAF